MRLLSIRVRWVLIFWMFLISAISYLDRVNMSVAGQFLQNDLHLSNTQLGYVFSAFVLGYALFQAPAGRLADKLGPRVVIALATVWWGVFTALSGSVSTAFAGALTTLPRLRRAVPRGHRPRHDLVGSFHCADCVVIGRRADCPFVCAFSSWRGRSRRLPCE